MSPVACRLKPEAWRMGCRPLVPPLQDGGKWAFLGQFAVVCQSLRRAHALCFNGDLTLNVALERYAIQILFLRRILLHSYE